MPLTMHETTTFHLQGSSIDQENSTFVVPGIHHEKSLEEFFLRNSKNGCIPGGRVLRMEDLVFRYLFSRAESASPISNSLKREIIRNILIAAKSQKELLHFGTIYGKSGLIDRMVEATTLLKQARVRPSELEMILAEEKPGDTRKKLSDLLTTFSHYTAFLRNSNLKDREDCFEMFRGLLEGDHITGETTNLNSQDLLSKGNHLIFSGFNTLSTLEIEIIKALSRVLNVDLYFRGKPDYLESFGLTKEMPDQENFHIPSHSKIVSAFDLSHEVSEISNYILEKVRNDNYRFSDFSVIIKNKSRYAPLFKRFFSDCNIPLKTTINTPLNHFPVYTDLFDFLKDSVREAIKKDELEVALHFQKHLSEGDLIKKLAKKSDAKSTSSFIHTLRATAKFEEAIKETEATLRTLDTVFSYNYFLEVFSNISKSSTVEEVLDQNDGVRILDYRYCQATCSKVIIVPGMIDGVYPSRPELNPVLDNRIKFLLREVHGYRIPDDREIEAIERNLFYGMTTGEASEFLFTYCRSNPDNTPDIPSIFLAPLMEEDTRDSPRISVFPGGRVPQKDTLEEPPSTHLSMKNLPVTFSPTAIENFASCPYKYFLSKILQLAAEREYGLDIPPPDRGTLLHRTLEAFFSSHGGFLLIKENPEKAAEVITELFEDFFGKIIPYASSYLNLLKTHLIRKLKAFVAKEHEDHGSEAEALTPHYFEKRLIARVTSPDQSAFSFEIIPAGSARSEGGIYIEAVIDRVDINRQRKFFGIVDYKLKSAELRGIKDILEAKKFQLPIYACLLSHLPEFSKFSLSYAYFYKLFSLDRSEGIFVKNADTVPPSPLTIEAKKANVITPGEFSHLLETSLESVMSIIRRIRNLEFPIDPKNAKECDHCDFGDICRIKKH